MAVFSLIHKMAKTMIDTDKFYLAEEHKTNLETSLSYSEMIKAPPPVALQQRLTEAGFSKSDCWMSSIRKTIDLTSDSCAATDKQWHTLFDVLAWSFLQFRAGYLHYGIVIRFVLREINTRYGLVDQASFEMRYRTTLVQWLSSKS